MPVLFVGRHLFKIQNYTWGHALGSLSLQYSFLFYIWPMFFMIEWFLIVSISLFKCIFADSVVNFFMIVSKISCNFFFVCSVCHLALVEKEAVKFIYTSTIYWLCFLFRDYVFIMQIDNWFYVCHAAITCFRIIFAEYFMRFMVVCKMFLN